jgi:hypothetical protein
MTISFFDDVFPGGEVAVGCVSVRHDVGVPELFVSVVVKSYFHGSESVTGYELQVTGYVLQGSSLLGCLGCLSSLSLCFVASYRLQVTGYESRKR